MIGYGLVSLAQVKHFSQAVCDVLGKGENNSAVYLLCETAAAETQFGTVPDRTRNGAGRGLLQHDKISFVDIQQRASLADVAALDKAFDFDIRLVEWDDLNYSPLLSMTFGRLHYKLRPGAIPQALRARAEYWKRWYNTVKGKGTVEHYLESVARFRNFY